MSHKLFRHSILSDARVWAFLKRVDAAEASVCRAARCPRCGGELHSATYLRKPYGLAADLRDDARRFSLCCSVCRRRVKPPSVRFFGRRVLCRRAVPPGERAGCGRRLAPSDDRAAVRGSGVDAEALAALVAGGVSADPRVAGEAGRAGGDARGGAATLAFAFHPGAQLPFAAASEPGLADAVDGFLRARRRFGISRRKRFCHERIGRSTPASPQHGEGGMPG